MLKRYSVFFAFAYLVVFKAYALNILNITFDGDLPTGVESKSPAADDAISIVESGGRDGGAATKIKVLNSPDYHSDGKVRAEYNTMGIKATSYQDGDEFEYEFSFKLDSSWMFDDRSSVDIIWQFKRTDGQPDMFVGIKGSDLILRIGEEHQMLLARSLRKGEWADVKLHIKFSKRENGYVQGYFKYATAKEFDSQYYSGSTFREREGGTTYLKWGIYKPDCSGSVLGTEQPHILYLDEISVIKSN